MKPRAANQPAGPSARDHRLAARQLERADLYLAAAERMDIARPLEREVRTLRAELAGLRDRLRRPVVIDGGR